MEQKPTETKQSRKLFVTLASPKVLSLEIAKYLWLFTHLFVPLHLIYV